MFICNLYLFPAKRRQAEDSWQEQNNLNKHSEKQSTTEEKSLHGYFFSFEA